MKARGFAKKKMGKNLWAIWILVIHREQLKSKLPWAAHGWIVQSQVYFCPCGKTSLCAKLLVWKYDVTCTVIPMKIKWFSWFSWEAFCTSTRSANGISDGGYTLFCFIRMLFFRPRLNILISLAILGWKHSCIILKL